uniref:Transposase Tc1-like domain-containing protein n=1 Tax=Esox lucius TaxID=8010 RepID=A0AAY5JY66_ESOLU
KENWRIGLTFSYWCPDSFTRRQARTLSHENRTRNSGRPKPYQTKTGPEIQAGQNPIPRKQDQKFRQAKTLSHENRTRNSGRPKPYQTKTGPEIQAGQNPIPRKQDQKFRQAKTLSHENRTRNSGRPKPYPTKTGPEIQAGQNPIPRKQDQKFRQAKTLSQENRTRNSGRPTPYPTKTGPEIQAGQNPIPRKQDQKSWQGKTLSHENRTRNTGRPKSYPTKTGPEIQAFFSKQDPHQQGFQPDSEDLKRAGTTVSKKTISNPLHRHGLKSCSARKVPLLKPAHVQARLKFANDHLDDPEEEWEKVMWSDETKIELFGLNSTRHVWRKKKDEYIPKNTIPTVKHGG